MFSPKQNLRMILACVCMLVFPAWAGPSNTRDDDAPTVLEVIWGVVDWATSCNENDQECKKREGEYRKREKEENARRAKEARKKWNEKNRNYKSQYLGLALTSPFVAEEREVMFGLELTVGLVFRFGEFFGMMGGGANATLNFVNAELFYRPPLDMNGVWKIAPEVGAGVTYKYFDDETHSEPLYHYSLGVRYEHTLQSRENIVEDEDVLINGVSVGCAVWMNYADFAGVKCDVRFGLYL
ncbi:MAG: hypothetical protein J5791_09400 [Fibrobacter sp.]|nr:hypothetical protein [Fibrobacter sp.]